MATAQKTQKPSAPYIPTSKTVAFVQNRMKSPLILPLPIRDFNVANLQPGSQVIIEPGETKEIDGETFKAIAAGNVPLDGHIASGRVSVREAVGQPPEQLSDSNTDVKNPVKDAPNREVPPAARDKIKHEAKVTEVMEIGPESTDEGKSDAPKRGRGRSRKDG